jgi:serine/threonine protein kinase
MIDQQSPTQVNLSALKPPASDPPSIVDDRYVLEQRLGGGGMGVVYRARDRLMERHHDRDPYVALKLISDAMRGNDDARTLLQRECSRAQKLSHPNIIRVFYFGCDEKTDADYVTMELLLGEPLEHLIRDHPKGLPWERSSRLIDQLCSGLAHAHGHGIVHSDIKPSNLFITDESILKILDFGIAAPMRSAATGSAETLLNPRRLGAVSERYSSLEMHLGLDADPSDDVYSAACVIYELLSGQHPYRTLTTPQAAQENIKPAPLACLNKTQNRALLKALNFRRSERTATIDEIRNGLLTVPRPLSMRRYRTAAAAIVVAAAGLSALIAVRGLPKHSVAAVPAVSSPERAAAATPAPLPAAPSKPQTDAVLQEPLASSGPSLPAVEPQASQPASKSPPLMQAGKLAAAATAAEPRKTAARKVEDRRCASLEERIQLGETISEQDHAFFIQNCQ